MSRYALAFWFAGIAALGLLRFWMKWREAGDAVLPHHAWLWLAGAIVCIVVAVAAAVLARKRN